GLDVLVTDYSTGISLILRNNPTNRAPVLAAIATNQFVAESSPLTFTATATDPDAGQTVTYSLDAGAPAGAAIDPTTGVFTWTAPNGHVTGSVAVRVRDTGTPSRDGAKTNAITVSNVAPSVTINGAPASRPEGTAISLTSTVTDPSSADTSAG